jgi:hypothetical protein
MSFTNPFYSSLANQQNQSCRLDKGKGKETATSNLNNGLDINQAQSGSSPQFPFTPGNLSPVDLNSNLSTPIGDISSIFFNEFLDIPETTSEVWTPTYQDMMNSTIFQRVLRVENFLNSFWGLANERYRAAPEGLRKTVNPKDVFLGGGSGLEAATASVVETASGDTEMNDTEQSASDVEEIQPGGANDTANPARSSDTKSIARGSTDSIMKTSSRKSVAVSGRSASTSTASSRRSARSERRRAKKQSKSRKSSSSKSSNSQRGKKGHIKGFNRATGQLTVCGLYPPIELGPEAYRCPHPLCAEFAFRSQNGYKYHLINACPQNPDGDYYRRLENRSQNPGRSSSFSGSCEHCGAKFRSENGLRMHLSSNETTKNGRCAKKRNRQEPSCDSGLSIKSNSGNGFPPPPGCPDGFGPKSIAC